MTEKIIEKISKYNLFNYLLPGFIFIIFISKTTKFDLIELLNENIIIILFLAYFTGTIISRFGSLIVEPVLKKIKFIKIAGYPKYLEALKKDNKLDDLSAENNTYRTYTSLFFIILLLHLAIFILKYFSLQINNLGIILPVFLFALFLFSYKKQTSYIENRVNKNLKGK